MAIVADYECHITVEPSLDFELITLCKLGEIHNWKTSYIEGDPDLGKGSRYFFTKHFNDLDKARENTNNLSDAIFDMDILVVRKKIELVIADTKNHTW